MKSLVFETGREGTQVKIGPLLKAVSPREALLISLLVLCLFSNQNLFWQKASVDEENASLRAQISGLSTELASSIERIKSINHLINNLNTAALKEDKPSALNLKEASLALLLSTEDFFETEGSAPIASFLKNQSDDLKEEVYRLSEKLDEVEGFLRKSFLAISKLPTKVPVLKGYISSNFGRRVSPFDGRVRPHRGVDIRASVGTPILAAASGVVSYVGWNGSFGKTVVISHDFCK